MKILGWRKPSGGGDPRPIFVLGNQKSGTTVIAALLAKAAGVSVALDLRGIHEPVQGQLHRQQLPFGEFVTANRRDFSRQIIKEPALTLLVPQLDAHFPGARYVFVVRDPRQNIRSILNRVGIAGNLEDFDEVAAAARVHNWAGWRTVLRGDWLGIPHRDYIGALAGRWNLFADIFEANRSRFVLMRYEDFVVDKVAAVQALASAVGLPSSNDVSRDVDRQYQAPGDRSVALEEFFGAANLARVNSICALNMSRLGYTPDNGLKRP